MPERSFRQMSDLATQARREGYSSLICPVFPPDMPKSPGAYFLVRGSDQKYGYYTVVSDIIDRSVSRAAAYRDSREPFGLVQQEADRLKVVKKFPKRDPYKALANAMSTTLNTALREEIGFLQDKATTDPESPEADSHNALQRWVDFQTRHIVYIDPAFEIGGGIATAVRSMVGTLKMLPELYQSTYSQKPSKDELIQIAQNTYPMLVDFAVNYEGTESSRALSKLSTKEGMGSWNFFDPTKFELIDKAGKIRVIPKESVLEEAKDEMANQNKDPLIGCPAAVNFGEGSAIRRLWLWHVDIVRTTPQTFYPNAA